MLKITKTMSKTVIPEFITSGKVLPKNIIGTVSQNNGIPVKRRSSSVRVEPLSDKWSEIIANTQDYFIKTGLY